MDPILIKLGGLEIRWYGLFLVLAIFAGFEIAKRLITRWGFDPERFEGITFWAVIWGVIGARVGYVLTSPAEFNANPVEALYIWRGGLSFHGAIIGGILPYVYAYYRYKIPVWAYLDAVVPGIALGVIAGRLGNIMNGSDTVGRLTDWPIGFTWPTWAKGFPGICQGINDISEVARCAPDTLVRGPVHFTQLYGVIIGIILLILAYYWLRQNRAYGYVFWQFVLWYSLLRAGLEETFRLNPLWLKVYLNPQAGIGLFTATQIISVPLIILALVLLARWPRTRKPAAEPAPAVPNAKSRAKRG
ncbi:prolipoprotein diacylglyceryl transferase [Meiothermus granaticius]|uniref:Phosphatidylglycerol--prolipoprotein diacylglyceryl transferase n=1 Tax=Meiothermus granaticius NBRC 107808 TaxID=1227551 RepID=A0A399F5E5_9DEIN|nr:prolipoprotein diacylglyceryl transferase [Meiothermus granaticius]RIH91293.1 Prolipoprotein diacylglyceryl transferase [Meiothermus granaticius NBRC 107808]GEM86140.1 prolipoprotein diacylglyceryl transferase [Meiothermus granaticius NBRC 107808]